MGKDHSNYKSSLKTSGQAKGQVGKASKLMKMGTDKVPQRRTHKTMTGMQMLDKMAAKQAPKKPW